MEACPTVVSRDGLACALDAQLNAECRIAKSDPPMYLTRVPSNSRCCAFSERAVDCQAGESKSGLWAMPACAAGAADTELFAGHTPKVSAVDCLSSWF